MMVEVHRITLLIIDHDQLGAIGVKEVIEDTHYPNHCIAPTVLALDTREVEWSDSHPINQRSYMVAEVDRLFGAPANGGGPGRSGCLVSEHQPQEQGGGASEQDGAERPDRCP